MKKITILTLFACLVAVNSFADLIWQEKFNYSNGPASFTSTNGTGSTTISNWITHSGALDAYVLSNRLEVSTSSTFGGVTTTRTGDINRQFATTNNSVFTNTHQLMYASFIVNFTNLPTANGAYVAHFKAGVPTSSTFQGRLWALAGNPAQTTNNFTALPNSFRLGVSATGSGSPSKMFGADLTLNNDYQVVLGWDPVTLLAVSLWVNPISSSDPSATSGDPFSPTAGNVANSFAFRQASGFGGFFTASNLVIATTFDEALTNGASTNAVAPKIVSQPVGNTNFTGSAVSVAAIAIGQGLASLTYQWQYTNAANPAPVLVSNPNGNTNVLSIDTSIGFTNYYSVIVTTPFGLSATSAVAVVKISDAPVPPSFTIHPASQTAYKGQNVTFSTTVVSPVSGNPVAYTWYSNNVVITAGQSDNGLSSTYTLNNVQTNFSATYKVAATNFYGGVVSSNAVLVVTNPPTVSIAYLRSLIDSTTLTTTASPTQPFQATGIVTSYTNTTSGDTSSYYLQDATAGINIFATFGSTFRPLQGDQVTFIGVLSTFNAATGGLELFADTVNRTYTSYTINSSGNPLPAARVIPFTVTNDFGYLYLNTNLMGSRLTLTNVFFGTNAGAILSTSSNQVVVVTNQNGARFSLQFYSQALDTAGQTLPTYATSVTGNLIGFHPNVFLAVTKWSDIVTNVAPVLPIPLNATFGPGGGITFNWSDATFSLQTTTNLLSPWTTVPGATSPFVTNTTSATSVFYRLFHP
jgi:hypothetical protein